MAKQGENIYQRKNGRWEGKYIKGRYDGKIRYGYISGSSYEDVLQKKRRMLAKTGALQSTYTQAIPCMSDVAAAWLNSRRETLKETTVVKYDTYIRNHINPALGDKAIVDISREAAEAFLLSKAKPVTSGVKPLSAKSINGLASVLRMILAFASKQYHIPTPCDVSVTLRQKHQQILILSQNEQNRLEDRLLEEMSLTDLGILTCLYTGIRLGEVCALKWGDVMMDDGILNIHATMSRVKADDDADHKTKIVITAPKSNCSVRQIPIPGWLLEHMKHMRYPDNTYFLTGRSDRYMDPRTMQNRFKQRLSESSIPSVKFHTLRHTFATRCVELNFDVKSLSELLGHANVTITMNRYVHPTIALKKDYMDRLVPFSEAKAS